MMELSFLDLTEEEWKWKEIAKLGYSRVLFV
jgi:hypothetical protein